MKQLLPFTLVILNALSAFGTPILSITTDNPASQTQAGASSPANLTGLTVAGGSFTSADFVAIASVSSANNAGIYLGTSVTPAPPGTYTVEQMFTDVDLTTGKANTVDMNMIFSSPFQDQNGLLPNLAIFEIASNIDTDSWTITPIVGGGASTPVFGGTALTFAQNNAIGFGSTGHRVSLRRNSTETLNQNLMGVALDFSDLGLNPTDVLYGVRVVSTGGDPNLIIGLNSVPEPGTAGYLLVGGLVGLLYRRRTRR